MFTSCWSRPWTSGDHRGRSNVLCAFRKGLFVRGEHPMSFFNKVCCQYERIHARIFDLDHAKVGISGLSVHRVVYCWRISEIVTAKFVAQGPEVLWCLIPCHSRLLRWSRFGDLSVLLYSHCIDRRVAMLPFFDWPRSLFSGTIFSTSFGSAGDTVRAHHRTYPAGRRT